MKQLSVIFAVLILATALAMAQAPATPAEDGMEPARIAAALKASNERVQAAVADIRETAAKINAYEACRKRRGARWHFWRRRCVYR